MAVHDVTYHLRVRVSNANGDDRLVSMSQSPDAPQETRAYWIQEVTRHIQSERSPEAIRPWNFIANLDGSVESLPVPDVEGESSGMYPAHYRIPPTSIASIEQPEQIMRQERFAFASLLYEVWLSKKPFERLSGEEVQQRYSNAEFPDDVRALPSELFIAVLSNWSVEFDRSINGLIGRVRSHIRAHPYLFALQATGALVGAAAASAPAILGAVGFSALGPVAGSMAAGWQGGLGAVQAGSVFAWCQSAAMGGAAVNGIIATGMAGGGVATLATAKAVGQGNDACLEEFQWVYKRG